MGGYGGILPSFLFITLTSEPLNLQLDFFMFKCLKFILVLPRLGPQSGVMASWGTLTDTSHVVR